MTGVSDGAVDALAQELGVMRAGAAWPISAEAVVRHVLGRLGQLGYVIRQERKPGARLVPVWMSDEIYLELVGGGPIPIRPMRLVPTSDGGFDLVLEAVPA